MPGVYKYNDSIPTQHYQDFAAAAGCGNAKSTFKCLVNADTAALQNASGTVSTSGAFGTFGFLPVIDGTFIQERPTVQLLQKKLSGKRILVGVNHHLHVPFLLRNKLTE